LQTGEILQSAVPVAIGALLVALAAGGVYLWRGTVAGRQTKYFYDLSEKRLYVASTDTLPPDVGIGGEPGDGVEALVVRCPRCGRRRDRIVYLTRLTPELRQRMLADRTSESGGAAYSRAEIFQQTLVCRFGEDVWHPLSTDEGKAIRDSWATRCPEHGEPLEPVVP